MSIVKSLIVLACVRVVHSGDWSTFVRNIRRRLLSQCRSLRQSALPFSMQRFFFGQCDILASVSLLLSDLRWPMPYLPLSKLFERIKIPFVYRFRLFDVLNDWNVSWDSLDKRVDDIKGDSCLLIDVWSSMPLIFTVKLVEHEDEAVVLTMC